MSNLPEQLTSFIGRQAEIAKVVELVAGSRLVTLTGTGGLGKTRLAIEAAHVLVDTFPGNVWFVDLTSRTSLSGVEQAVAGVLGLKEEVTTAPQALSLSLVSHLQTRAALLILDNCEHLIEATAQLADMFLRTCPQLRILATSRQPLGVAGEVVWRVPSLTMPDTSTLFGEDVANYDAVKLFVERARLKRSDFELTPANIQSVIDICRSLDGMPLAIELAAASIHVLSPEQIVKLMGNRFRLSLHGNRTDTPRQQTLMSLMDWSYELLSEPERSLLRSLAVFVDGFTLEACQALCCDGDEHTAIELLSNLVDKSLVSQEERDGVTRYRLIETIRQYAWHKLSSSQESTTEQNRHFRYFAELASRAENHLHTPEQATWLGLMSREHANFAAALAWGASSAELAEQALYMCSSLKWFWTLQGNLSEARERIEEVLSSPHTAEPGPARALCLNAAGLVLWFQSDDTAAKRYFTSSMEMLTGSGNASALAFSLTGLGVIERRHGNFAEARELLLRSLSLVVEADDKPQTATTLMHLGLVDTREGRYNDALAYLERSRALFEELGDGFGTASALSYMARSLLRTGDYHRVAELLVESLVIFADLGVRIRVALSLIGLAELSYLEGDPVRAIKLYASSQTLLNSIGSAMNLAYSEEAKHNFRAARERLDPAALEEAWTAGAAMTMQEAVNYALEGLARAVRAVRIRRLLRVRQSGTLFNYETGNVENAASLLGLSSRELQVLRNVAAGLSDPQIASALHISSRTVEAHLRSVYNKLEVTNRRAAVKRAAELNLL